MACRGVYFALTADEATSLRAAEDNESVLLALAAIAGKRDDEWLQRTDQTWDAMHRALSNGTLYYDEGEYPLNRTVLGGEHLYDGDDVVVSYVPPDEVKDVAGALAPITEQELRRRYDAIDPDDYDGEHGETDFGATWECFQSVRNFYVKAASAGRAVVFKVDP
jgi:hypothetical protein